MEDDLRFTEGLLNLAEAGRYLRIPQQTFHRWARGYERGKPLLHLARSSNSRLPVSLIALAEGHVLDVLRDAGVRPRKIRPALQRLQQEFGTHYVLTSKELATDGIDVLWDFARSPAGEGLIAGHNGQHVLRGIVQDQMSYIGYDSAGIPNQVVLRHWQPSKVVVDLRRSFGQPIFAGTGARVADVAGMLKAGENPDTVAEEFGLSVSDVGTAARILLGRAA